MKNKSPAHRLIQLRRKTQKIVLPKASWDLSNKQNKDCSNCYEGSKSKNTSSKKSSVDKKLSFKKSQSMTQNTLKNTLKYLVKDAAPKKKEKQASKSKSHYNSRKTMDSSHIKAKGFVQSMNYLKKTVKNSEDIQSMSKQYQQSFKSFSSVNPQQIALIKVMEEHLGIWMHKCQQLHHTIQILSEPTPKMNEKGGNLDIHESFDKGKQFFNEGSAFINSSSISRVSNTGSQPSDCSYIVDPQEEISMRPLNQELKKKLQLNFSKIDSIRKKQYME